MHTDTSLSQITNRFTLLNLGEDQRPQATLLADSETKSPDSKDFTRLVELAIIDESAKVDPQLPFDQTTTAELLSNLNHFLYTERSNGHALQTVLNAINRQIRGMCSNPLLIGEELKGILGWDFLSSKYLSLVQQKDPSAKISDCLSLECIEQAKSDCQLAGHTLTIRYHLLPHVENRTTVVDSVYGNLKMLLKDAISAPIHIDAEQTHFSSFCYESGLNGALQRIHFVFATELACPFITSSEAVQIELIDKAAVLIDNDTGNQWCVDTMLKILRVVHPSKNLAKLLFRYIKNGYDSRGSADEIIHKEVLSKDTLTLFDFWEKCNNDSPSNSIEHRLQNALFLCQAIAKTGQPETVLSFLDSIAAKLGPIDSQTSLWHASIVLLKDQVVSFDELESLLQIFAVAALTLHSTNDTKVSCTSFLGTPSLSFRSTKENSECTFIVPLEMQKALQTFKIIYTRIKDHEALAHLLDALCNNLSTKKRAHPQITLEDAPTLLENSESYIPLLLFSTLAHHKDLFRLALKMLPRELPLRGEIEQRMIKKALQVAFASQELTLPHHLQNGGIHSDTHETAWIEYLVNSGHDTCTKAGKELLRELTGHVKFKSRLIKSHPELALRLVKQIENDALISEADVKHWLLESPLQVSTLIWHTLVTSSSGRWLTLCVVTCPNFLLDVFTAKDNKAITALLAAINPENNRRSEYLTALLPFIINSTMLTQSPDVVMRTLEVLDNEEHQLSKKSKSYLRDQLNPFVEKSRELSLNAVAMRFLKVYTLHGCGHIDTTELFTCAENPLPKDLAEWYLSLRGSIIIYKADPARQVRIFLHIAKQHNSLICSKDSAYMGELYKRLQVNEELPRLQAEITTAKQALRSTKIDTTALFAMFFPVKKQKATPQKQEHPKGPVAIIRSHLHMQDWQKAARALLSQKEGSEELYSLAKLCIAGLLQQSSPSLAELTLALLSRYSLDSAEPWIQLFDTYSSRLELDYISAGIDQLLECKETMPDTTKREIWTKIIGNSQWLTSQKSVRLLDELEFFKTLFAEQSNTAQTAERMQNNLANALKIFIRILKTTPGTLQKHLPTTYKWHALLPATHKDKIALAFSLIKLCQPTDTIEVVTSACGVIDFLLPRLQSLCGTKHPAKPVSRKKQGSVSTPSIEELSSFCKAACNYPGNDAIQEPLLRFIHALGALEVEVADRFAVSHFWNHPAQIIKEALWPSLKRVLPLILTNQPSNHSLELPIATLQLDLLKTANEDILLAIFKNQFVRDSANALESNSPTVVQIRTQQPPIHEYTDAYPRLLSLCCKSQNPDHARDALIIDVTIQKFFPNQMQQIKDSIVDYTSLRLQLLLRQIQYNGWATTSTLLLENVPTYFLDDKRGHIHYKVHYTSGNSLCFYSYARNIQCKKSSGSHQAEEDAKIGSLYPEVTDAATQKSIPELFSLIYTSLRYACESSQTPEQKDNLLDFALQNIRNIIEHYPQVEFHFDCVQMLTKCVEPNDPLFSTHCSIIVALLRSAVRRGIVNPEDQAVVEILKYLKKDGCDLRAQTLTPLEEIHGALDTVTSERAIEVLVVAQNLVRMWQELHCTNDYTAWQGIMTKLFDIWQQHPFVAQNSFVLDSMSALLHTNSIRFGSTGGSIGKKAMLDVLSGYLTCNCLIYKTITEKGSAGSWKRTGNAMYYVWTKEGSAAGECLLRLTKELYKACSSNTYKGNYETFIAHAEQIMALYAAPSFFDVLPLSESAQIFTNAILLEVADTEDKAKQAALVHKWIQTIGTHCKDEDFRLLLEPITEKIVNSNIVLHFDYDQLQLLLISIDKKRAIGLLNRYEQLVVRPHLTPENTLSCLFLICKNLIEKQPPIPISGTRSKSKTPEATIPTQIIPFAVSCIKNMIFTLKTRQKNLYYEDRYKKFITDAVQICLLLVEPWYTQAPSIRQLVTWYISTICGAVKNDNEAIYRASLMYEWLKIVQVLKDTPFYADLLNETAVQMIKAEIIQTFGYLEQKENELLIAFLQSWHESGAQPDDELIESLAKQTGRITQLQAINTLEKSVIEGIEDLTVDDK